MATAKKPAAKKAAKAKKPVAKKSTAKKKPAKKPAAKKSTAKKSTATKKPAKKSTAKKPAAKKPAAKAAKKSVAKKPAAKKVSATSRPVETSDAKYRNLFDAYAHGKLPFSQGYIVSSFYSETTAYSIFEVVSYAGVKEIFPSGEGLQFISGGKKLFVLLENDTYDKKFLEPVSRAQGESIPKRFNELETIIAHNQTKIMVAKEPNELTGSFTILKPTSINFAVVFYQLPAVYTTLASFFEDVLNRQRRVPQMDAKKAAQLIASTVQKTMGAHGDYN
jgi:hypothetical protein